MTETYYDFQQRVLSELRERGKDFEEFVERLYTEAKWQPINVNALDCALADLRKVFLQIEASVRLSGVIGNYRTLYLHDVPVNQYKPPVEVFAKEEEELK